MSVAIDGADEALAAGRQARTLEHVSDGLVVLDREHRITASNRVAADITGRGATSLIGVRWSALTADAADIAQAVLAGLGKQQCRQAAGLRRYGVADDR